jgi:hypothetical protein
MSVDCRVFVGLTIELERNIDDFEKVHDFEDKYPELDFYNHHNDELEGKLLLIADGMDGDFARLIKVDKFIDGGYLGDANEFFELTAANSCFDAELIEKMSKLYEEYTGKAPTLSDFKYAIWSQWS